MATPSAQPQVPGIRYQLILILSCVPLLLFTLWQGIQHGGWRYIRQRLGLGYNFVDSRPVWLHAASVGEVIAAEPLVSELKKRHPEIPLLISTATPTGADTASKRLGNIAQHAYLPIDWPGAVRRYLNKSQPRCALIMETEIWPNLYRQCAAQDIPLLMVNARLTSRTLNTPAWIRRLYAGALANTKTILARSEKDAESFLQLGAPIKKVIPVGNIKFAAMPQTPAKEIDLGTQRPYVLLASSHDDEEQRIAKIWLGKNRGDTLLIIAPRHPKRSEAIQKQLKVLTPHIAVRSKNQPINTDTFIYLADTLGELLGFMQGAELVVMGGSFVPIGGHNILEPARLGKAIIVGPHVKNIASELEELQDQKAIIQVNNESELSTQVDRLLNDPSVCLSLGERTALYVTGKNDVLDEYLEAIERFV